jgi:hypothetical protein
VSVEDDDDEKRVEVGDRFYDCDGNAVIVVKGVAPRQTLAYWVHGCTHYYVKTELQRYPFDGTDDGMGWQITEVERNRIKHGDDISMSLCLLREWDPEENEFGKVMP